MQRQTLNSCCFICKQLRSVRHEFAINENTIQFAINENTIQFAINETTIQYNLTVALLRYPSLGLALGCAKCSVAQDSSGVNEQVQRN